MQSRVYIVGMITLIILLGCSNKNEITMATLLDEMTNRTQLAEFPSPDYNTKQFSSYDRGSVAVNEPGWFANADRSHFLRIENNKGRREFVMYDAKGPGAVTRIWITVANYGGNGTIRFYIDGKEKPEIEGEVLSVMSGGKLVNEPLASSVSKLTEYIKRGHNLYLPIPYNKSCKITYESESVTEKPGAETGEAFYYNINYRTYTDRVSVKSFSKSELQKHADKILQVNGILEGTTDAQELSIASIQKSKETLSPGTSAHQVLEGPKAISGLRVKLDAENLEQALRSTVLEIEFDGQRTVWCPVGDFYGTGYKISPYKTWYTEVYEDGTLYCKWIMPYANSAKVTLHNHGKQDVLIEAFEMETKEYNWTANSMHFGAGWFEQYHLETQKPGETVDEVHFDVNYVTLEGKGVLLGSGVTLFNTIDAWWGEGDEKIFVDNEVFPSHIGTGTEDYYGYAWSNPNNFDHPFIAQPDGSGAIESGHVVNQRYRALDAIPFHEKIQVDVEMWHWLKTTINHAPVSYWYMLPGGISNLSPDIKAVQNPVALSRLDFYLEGYYPRNIFMKKALVNIKAGEGYKVYYTTDGSTPNEKSKPYTKPFPVYKTTTVKAIGISAGGYTTEILEGEFLEQQPLAGNRLKSTKPGIKYDYFKLNDVLHFAAEMDKYKKTSSGVAPAMEFPAIELSELFGLKMKGYVKVPKAGIYTFATNSNDGSMLYVHGQEIVNNDGGHGKRERVGQISLAKGYHPIELVYFQMGGGKHLEVFMEGPGMEKHILKPTELFYE